MTLATSLQYVDGPPVSPKPNRMFWNNPNGVANAVFPLSSSAMSTVLNAPLRSVLEKMVDPARLSNVAAMLGMGYASFTVTEFRERQSVHHLMSPFFFFTATKFELHGLVEGSIIPLSSHSLSCFFRLSFKAGGMGR